MHLREQLKPAWRLAWKTWLKCSRRGEEEEEEEEEEGTALLQELCSSLVATEVMKATSPSDSFSERSLIDIERHAGKHKQLHHQTQ